MKKGIFRYFILALLIVGVTEISSWLALIVLEKNRNLSYQPIRFHFTEKQQRKINQIIKNQGTTLMHSKGLGWTPKPNVNTSRSIRTNAQGIRGDQDYALKPSPDVIRIAALGESYTWGYKVPNRATWPAQLSQINPRFETLNFGVTAYGMDQALLRYKQDAKSYNPHIVLMGYMSRDIIRSVWVYPIFCVPESRILAKPRFIIQQNELGLLPNPLATLTDYNRLLKDPKGVLTQIGKNDYYFQTGYVVSPLDFLASVRFFKILRTEIKRQILTEKIYDKNYVYNPHSEAFLITVKILEEFSHEVQQNGSVPIVLLLPDNRDLARHRKHRGISYAPLRKYLKTQKIPHYDLLEAFDAYGKTYSIDELFHQYHYSPLAYRIVAQGIASHLQKKGLTEPIDSPGSSKP